MKVDINDLERNLLLELIEGAEQEAIQGMDHADSRVFKDMLRKRLQLLESVKGKIKMDGAHL